MAQFAWGLRSNSSSTDLRNPRGPITLKRFGDHVLMLWYNDGAKSFGDTVGCCCGGGGVCVRECYAVGLLKCRSGK